MSTYSAMVQIAVISRLPDKEYMYEYIYICARVYVCIYIYMCVCVYHSLLITMLYQADFRFFFPLFELVAVRPSVI